MYSLIKQELIDMPLTNTEYGKPYIKTTKLFVNSSERTSGSLYNYVYTLAEEIQNVVAIELTGYNIPSEVTPTFIASGTNFVGNNKFNFYLENDAGASQTFTVTWPEKKYTYENTVVPYLSYISILEQLLNDAVKDDATFGTSGTTPVTFRVASDTDEKTVIYVVDSGAHIDIFTLLFSTGANASESSYYEMGFAASTNISATGAAGSKVLTSPNATQLSPYRFVDITIDQSEFQPLQRVYLMDNTYYGTTRNELNVSRTRLIRNNQIRKLNRLNIEMRLKNNIVPPTSARAHDLIFTVFSISPEQTLPKWLQQNFAL